MGLVKGLTLQGFGTDPSLVGMTIALKFQNYSAVLRGGGSRRSNPKVHSILQLLPRLFIYFKGLGEPCRRRVSLRKNLLSRLGLVKGLTLQGFGTDPSFVGMTTALKFQNYSAVFARNDRREGRGNPNVDSFRITL